VAEGLRRRIDDDLAQGRAPEGADNARARRSRSGRMHRTPIAGYCSADASECTMDGTHISYRSG
jgi:hypothetical protein